MKKSTFQQRFFAWMLRKSDSINHRLYHLLKKDLFKNIGGLVVEIGPGTGTNMEYLPVDTNWIGIEPNEALHETLIKRAAMTGIRAALVATHNDRISLDDNTADAFICTLVLCSVKDPKRTVAEIKRVLKPGGKLFLLEHVASSTSRGLLWFQGLVNPINRLVADGCNCNRRTWEYIDDANFSRTVLRHVDIPGAMVFQKPHIVGYAIK